MDFLFMVFLQIREGITSEHLFGLEDLFYKYGKEKVLINVIAFFLTSSPSSS